MKRVLQKWQFVDELADQLNRVEELQRQGKLAEPEVRRYFVQAGIELADAYGIELCLRDTKVSYVTPVLDQFSNTGLVLRLLAPTSYDAFDDKWN